MTTENIIKMAFDLGVAIAGSNQMEEVKRAQNLITLDQPAYELLSRYEELKVQIENRLNDGLLVSKMDEDHLNVMEQQINNSETVHELITAQEKFQSLIQGVYMAINQAIADHQTSSCGSDCGSCGSKCVM